MIEMQNTPWLKLATQEECWLKTVSNIRLEFLFRLTNSCVSPPRAEYPVHLNEVDNSDTGWYLATCVRSESAKMEGEDIWGLEVETCDRDRDLTVEITDWNAELGGVLYICKRLTFFAMSSAVWDASTVSAISEAVVSTTLGCASEGATATRWTCSRIRFSVSTLLISSSAGLRLSRSRSAARSRLDFSSLLSSRSRSLLFVFWYNARRRSCSAWRPSIRTSSLMSDSKTN